MDETSAGTAAIDLTGMWPSGTPIDRLTELWLEERNRDIALDLIAAKFKAERGAAEG